MALGKIFLTAIGLALVATGCGTARDEAATSSVPAPRGVYAVGATVFGLAGGPTRLASPPVAPLAGWLTPAAVPSPDGRYLAYNVWRELRSDDPNLSWTDQGIKRGDPLATPSLRIYDSGLGTDELLEDGAFSVAWRTDGALAYFKGGQRDYRAGVPYVGDIAVRPSREAPPQVWSPERARYVVAGWAGKRLVVYREREGEALDVLVLDAPGRMRVLAPDSALVAISPDGRQVFVEQGPAQGRPAVRVIDVADGREDAALALTRVDPAVGAVGYAGDWLGDRVVASSASGLAVFRVETDRIALEQAVRTERGGIFEPRFADATDVRITAWADGNDGGVLLDCDRSAGSCTRLVPLPGAQGVNGFPVWRRPLYNPSRPQ